MQCLECLFLSFPLQWLHLASFLSQIPHGKNAFPLFLPSFHYCYQTSSENQSSRPVFLVDASTIRQQGKEQSQQRVHLCYSLNENQMQQLLVTDYHTAESFQHFSMKKGDIFLADAGYGTAKNYAYAMEQQADVILRINPNHFCVYDAEGTKMDWLSFFRKKKGQKDTIMVATHKTVLQQTEIGVAAIQGAKVKTDYQQII